MYDQPGHHQSDTTGNQDEAQRPIYYNLFFQYFDYVRNNSNSAQAAAQAEMNVRVNRSIIGQQPALSSQANGPVELLSNVAPNGRGRGSGDVGNDVVINIMEDQQIISPQPSHDHNQQCIECT